MSRTMQIESAFHALGARVRVSLAPTGPYMNPAPLILDIGQDDLGEFFELRCRADATLKVPDIRADDRHLLLVASAPHGDEEDAAGGEDESTFLCGHDERHWFVAAIPETAQALDVQSAKDALKPQAVWDSMRSIGVPFEHRDRRRTAAFIRQGEWFFIPKPRFRANPQALLKDEPIQRGGGKPHRCQFLYRINGERVYVCEKHPDGLTVAEYQALFPWERRAYRWAEMVRGARVFVKGNIRHPDHKTVWLSEWHEVVMNRETEAKAMQHVAFLD
jgi:hypothetical protein